MNKLLRMFSLIAVFGIVTGCSINHPIAKDYPAFLSKNAGTGDLPKTELDTDYSIAGSTESHRYEFRAATVGYAHVWIVEFGKILDQTLNAPYVQNSFGRFDKRLNNSDSAGSLVQFTLENYEFKNYRAYVSVKIELTKDAEAVLSKTYSAEGDSKGGQMWGAGPFGMKSATLASTKSAIDNILKQFLNDIPNP
ncbi:MAG: hypothetical protein COA42_22555 [Alteromonadaceae bacterium]|nr:MAG: hypothetical protein COA42_22555 [Alteromonadaceae bacterium]